MKNEIIGLAIGMTIALIISYFIDDSCLSASYKIVTGLWIGFSLPLLGWIIGELYNKRMKLE